MFGKLKKFCLKAPEFYTCARLDFKDAWWLMKQMHSKDLTECGITVENRRPLLGGRPVRYSFSKVRASLLVDMDSDMEHAVQGGDEVRARHIGNVLDSAVPGGVSPGVTVKRPGVPIDVETMESRIERTGVRFLDSVDVKDGPSSLEFWDNPVTFPPKDIEF